MNRYQKDKLKFLTARADLARMTYEMAETELSEYLTKLSTPKGTDIKNPQEAKPAVNTN